MSALDFLAPALAADADGFHPVARSSMERRQRDLGATFVERDGWLVPAALPGEAEHLQRVGIADLSHLGKLEVRTAPAEAPPATGGDGVVGYRISPRRSLLVCPTAQTTPLRTQLEASHRLVLDVSAALGILALMGPERWTLLRRLTHLHTAPSSGEVAHVNGVHLLEAGEALWLVFPQELGHYLWEVAVDRAAPLGGGPVGVDAQAGAGT